LPKETEPKKGHIFQGISDLLRPSLPLIPGRSFTYETDLFRPSNRYSLKNRKTPLFDSFILIIDYRLQKDLIKAAEIAFANVEMVFKNQSCPDGYRDFFASVFLCWLLSLPCRETGLVEVQDKK